MLASSAQPNPPHRLKMPSRAQLQRSPSNSKSTADEVMVDSQRSHTGNTGGGPGRLKGLFSLSNRHPSSQSPSPSQSSRSIPPESRAKLGSHPGEQPSVTSKQSESAGLSANVTEWGARRHPPKSNGAIKVEMTSSGSRLSKPSSLHQEQVEVGTRPQPSMHSQARPLNDEPPKSWIPSLGSHSTSALSSAHPNNASVSSLHGDHGEPGSKRRMGGRHSLAALFQRKSKNVSSVSPDRVVIAATGVASDTVTVLDSPDRHSNQTTSPHAPHYVSARHNIPYDKYDYPEQLSDHHDSQRHPQPLSQSQSHLWRKGVPPTTVEVVSNASLVEPVSNSPPVGVLRPSVSTRSNVVVRQSSRVGLNNGPYPKGILNTGPPSTSSLAGYSALGASLSQTSLFNMSRTSLSLSQTSLLLPDTSSRDALLSRDHYHLRFATTYINMLVTPVLRSANFSQSEKNQEIKRIAEQRLAKLARMERTWGSSWAEAASELLSSSPLDTSVEVKEAKLRACNITATAKARERRVFAEGVGDGIIMCFLFNCLFPAQPAHIQRVKVPKDQARVIANLQRFQVASREMGVPESELFTLEDLDEHSPRGLAKVARTILVLAQMSSCHTAPRVRVRIDTSAADGSRHKPARDIRGDAALQPSSPSRTSPLSKTPVTSRSILERRLHSSASDLLARLKREEALNASIAQPAPEDIPRVTIQGSLGPPISDPNLSTTPKLLPSALDSSTAPTSPPAIPTSNSATLSLPATSRSPTRTSAALSRPGPAKSSTEAGSPRASAADWSLSNGYHPQRELAPLREGDRTPSLISSNSQLASSYSRSSFSYGAVPVIVGDDHRPLDTNTDNNCDQLSPSSEPIEPAGSGRRSPRRLSEQTLHEARRKLGTLLSSTEDLPLVRSGVTDEARHSALSQSLAALEGSVSSRASSVISSKPWSESPRLRPVSRGSRLSAELQPQKPIAEDESPEASEDSPETAMQSTSELPPRPCIRRPSATGKIYVPKRVPSPASPGLSMSPYRSTTNLSQQELDEFAHLSKGRRRRSADYPPRHGFQPAGGRLMTMKNNSMVNLPTGQGRLPSTLSHSSRESSVHHHTQQVLTFIDKDGDTVRYQVGNCIGRGQFGSVYRSLNLSTGQMVAIKRIRLGGMVEKEVGDVMREVELLQRLSHPGIVKYERMSRDEKFLNIVLEFVENGSLGQTLRAFGTFNERLVASYVAKILEGLNYLHSQGVVHCDLKAANILSTKNGNIKLTDFGVSLHMRAVETFAERASGSQSDASKTADIAGTPNWMAPEIIKLAGPSPASDIWSLGCTVIELVTGKPPYYGVGNSMTVLFRIVEDDMPPLPVSASAELIDFLKLCFAKKPEDRPTAALLFEHDWVRAGHPDILNRPLDSLPFLRRVSQEPHRLESQRVFSTSTSGARSASTSLVDVTSTMQLDGSYPETAARAQMSMVSLHSHYSQSKDILDSTIAKAHSLVKTNFAKPITCHVCLEGVKRSAYLCQNCGLITHTKCSGNAQPRCDVREQLNLLATQQDWLVQPSAPSSVEGHPGNGPVKSLPARLFGWNRSKTSLVMSSTTSLVESAKPTPTPPPEPHRRQVSSGSMPNQGRQYLDTNVSRERVDQVGVGSLRSRHSETSEDGGSSARGTTSLIRIDEDAPAGPITHHTPRRYAPPMVPTEPVLEPDATGISSANRPGRRRGRRIVSDGAKSDCVIA